MAEEVVALFQTLQTPTTFTKINQLLGKDVSKELKELVENNTIKVHSLAPGLSLYWPSSWYKNETASGVVEKKEEVQEKEEIKEVDLKETPKVPKDEDTDKDIFKTPPPKGEKVNHLAAASGSLKARLAARRKRPTTPSASPPSATTPSPSSSPSSSPVTPSSPTSPSPSSSPSSTSASASTSTSTSTTPTSTPKSKSPSTSWLTPSPKRRKVLPNSKSSPPDKCLDLESLEKEKKRLESLVEQKEAQLLKKNKTATNTTKKDKEKEKETERRKEKDDKQLDILIQKWRAGCQQMLIDLQLTTKQPDGTGGITLGQLIDTFQFERSLFPDYQEDADCFG